MTEQNEDIITQDKNIVDSAQDEPKIIPLKPLVGFISQTSFCKSSQNEDAEEQDGPLERSIKPNKEDVQEKEETVPFSKEPGAAGRRCAGCGKKAAKGKKLCKICDALETEKKKITLSKDSVVTALFGFHLAAYMNLEIISKIGGVNLEGLPKKLVEQQEYMQVLYGQIYDEYGPEAITQYVGPMYSLLLTSAAHVSASYIENN